MIYSFPRYFPGSCALTYDLIEVTHLPLGVVLGIIAGAFAIFFFAAAICALVRRRGSLTQTTTTTTVIPPQYPNQAAPNPYFNGSPAYLPAPSTYAPPVNPPCYPNTYQPPPMPNIQTVSHSTQPSFNPNYSGGR